MFILDRRALLKGGLGLLEVCALSAVAAPLAALQGCGGMLSETRAKALLATGSPEDIYSLIEEGRITPGQLFKAILREYGFAAASEPVVSENPDTPIFVILEDTHGSPEVELQKLERLRTRFGINFVGIEGWAGAEADKSRGHMLLNAEKELIKILLANPRYKVVGLEDPDLQEQGLKLLATICVYLSFVNARVSKMNKSEDNVRESFKFLGGAVRTFAEMNPKYAPMYQEVLKSTSRPELKSRMKAIYKLPEFQKMLKEASEELGLSFLLLERMDRETIEQYESRVVSILELAHEDASTVIIHERNAAAVRILASKNTPKVCAIVFGATHGPGLIKELQKRGDCSILSISNDGPS